jgi:hypothetical protein
MDEFTQNLKTLPANALVQIKAHEVHDRLAGRHNPAAKLLREAVFTLPPECPVFQRVEDWRAALEIEATDELVREVEGLAPTEA